MIAAMKRRPAALDVPPPPAAVVGAPPPGVGAGATGAAGDGDPAAPPPGLAAGPELPPDDDEDGDDAQSKAVHVPSYMQLVSATASLWQVVPHSGQACWRPHVAVASRSQVFRSAAPRYVPWHCRQSSYVPVALTHASYWVSSDAHVAAPGDAAGCEDPVPVAGGGLPPPLPPDDDDDEQLKAGHVPSYRQVKSASFSSWQEVPHAGQAWGRPHVAAAASSQFSRFTEL
jgi:hypothetical protein